MKKLVLVFLLLSLKVNAWVLYPSMNVSNANSEMWIAANSKIGDKLRSASGSQNYALVKSISGRSSRCQDTNLPISANIELIIGASPKFTMEVPDEFKAQKLPDILYFSRHSTIGSLPKRPKDVVVIFSSARNYQPTRNS